MITHMFESKEFGEGFGRVESRNNEDLEEWNLVIMGQ